MKGHGQGALLLLQLSGTVGKLSKPLLVQAAATAAADADAESAASAAHGVSSGRRELLFHGHSPYSYAYSYDSHSHCPHSHSPSSCDNKLYSGGTWATHPNAALVGTCILCTDAAPPNCGNCCSTAFTQTNCRAACGLCPSPPPPPPPHRHCPHSHSPSSCDNNVNSGLFYSSDGTCVPCTYFTNPSLCSSYAQAQTNCRAACGLCPSPPPPPPPSLYFTVTSGPCTVDPSAPNCIRSPNFPSGYGNFQACSITSTALAIGRPLTATSFDTEAGYDYLHIPSHPSGTLTAFSGSTGPSNFILGPGTIRWSANLYHASTGWRVCSHSWPPPPPPSPPPPPPPPPSPPDVGFSPSTVAPNTQIILSVLGSFASPGDTLVLLPAGTPDCTGAVYASSSTGGVVSAEYTLGVTIGVSGTYKTCISRRTRPTLDSQFDYLDGPRLVVSVQVLAGTATSPIQVLAQQVADLSTGVAALSGALSCGAGGRRLDMDTDMSFAPSVSEPSESTTAKAIVDDFLSRRPDLAMTLTAEQRAVIEDLGQHFGLPALA